MICAQAATRTRRLPAAQSRPPTPFRDWAAISRTAWCCFDYDCSPLRASGADSLLQKRDSKDNPRLNAFCRVAPSVLFNVRAILAAGVFLRASVFNVRTCWDVHARRFPFRL